MERNNRKCYYKIHTLIICISWLLYGVNSQFSTPGCGLIDDAIAKLDKRASAPWTATVFYQSSQCDFRSGGFGNGVIIGPTTILMSGNFLWKSRKNSSDMFGFQEKSFVAIVGLKSKLAPLEKDEYTQFIKVENIQPHPRSYEVHSEYDYAIVHLKNAIQFSTRVRPICLETLEKAKFNDLSSKFLQNGLFLTGYGLPRNEIQKKSFEFKQPDFCKSKLKDGFSKPQVSPLLSEVGCPCGIIPGTLTEPGKNEGGKRFVISNSCYQKGAALTTYINNRWHLAGLVTECLGFDCTKSLYFISAVSLKPHLMWILSNIRNGPNSFVCNNGQQINLKKELCNNFKDCDDKSDENEQYCEARKCKRYSQYCSTCSNNDTLTIQRKSYSFSTSVPTEEIRCPTIIPPKNVDVFCEEQDLNERISCKNGGSVGSKAIFRCQKFDYSNPIPTSYCVATCLSSGKWTEGLSQLKCEDNSVLGASTAEEDFISDRQNFATWFEELTRLDTQSKTEAPVLAPIVAVVNENDNTGQTGCPGITTTEEITVTCRDPVSSKIINCTNRAMVGTKAEFGCSRYYKPVLTSNSLVKTCERNGQWKFSNRNFDCRLDCGVPKSYLKGHIVNGGASDETSWPWHATLFVQTKHKNYTYICGATLISKKILLTAAHCLANRNGVLMDIKKYKVVVGASSSDFEENTSDPNSQIFEIRNASVNPAFNSKSFEADIAIVQLSKPAKITDYVRPACFPTSTTIHNELLHTSPGSSGYIIGFGYDENGKISHTIKEAKLPVVSYSECYRVLNIQPSSTMYCAGFTNGTSACSGDSGGGHFFSEEVHPNRLFLQGIISHGNSGKVSRLCDNFQYTVFTKVASFKNWIYEQGLELDEDFL